MKKKTVKLILVVLGIVFVINAIYGLTTEDKFTGITILNVFNLIVWPIIILFITGLAEKIDKWWYKED